MGLPFILALFVLPAAICAAAVWLALRTRPRDLGRRSGTTTEPIVPSPGADAGADGGA